MRKIYLLVLVVLTVSYFGNAQELVITPQVGFENSKTKTLYSNSPYFMGDRNSNPLFGLRLSYQSKKGHGPYVGVGFTSATVSYESMDGGITYHSFRGSVTDVLRVQAGYQWNTKPIYLKRLWDSHTSTEQLSKEKNKGWSVRFQPYIGVGMDLRNANSGFIQNNTGTITSYANRNNVNLSAGINLEFGRNDKKKFTLGIGYTQGISNSRNTTIIQNYNGNNYQTQLENRSSGFNITLGVPLTIWKKNK